MAVGVDVEHGQADVDRNVVVLDEGDHIIGAGLGVDPGLGRHVQIGEQGTIGSQAIGRIPHHHAWQIDDWAGTSEKVIYLHYRHLLDELVGLPPVET